MSILTKVKNLPIKERRELFEALRPEFEDVPDWHLRILEERKEKVDRGEMKYSTHEEVFCRIRDKKAAPLAL